MTSSRLSDDGVASSRGHCTADLFVVHAAADESFVCGYLLPSLTLPSERGAASPRRPDRLRYLWPSTESWPLLSAKIRPRRSSAIGVYAAPSEVSRKIASRNLPSAVIA